MKLTRKLLAAMLSVCMALALLTPAASAADLTAGYSPATYYDIAVTTYSRMLMFQNGVVAAADQSRQYGLIDPTGRVVVPFQYAYVWALDGGLFAFAQNDDGDGALSGLGIMDSAGKIVLAPSASYIDISCQNSTICVTIRVPGSYSTETRYFTTSMQPTTEDAYWGGSNGPLAQYDGGWPAGNGYYIVYKYTDDGWRPSYGLLDSNYKVIIPVGTYSDIDVATDGGKTVFVVAKDERWAVLDTSLKEVVPFGTYDMIYPHYNGGGTLDVGSGSQTGVIDFTGKVLVPVGDYSVVGGLNAGGYISAVSMDGSSSTLFKDGQVVKTYAGKQVTSEVYYRHLAFSTTGEKNGIMDMDEKVLIKEQYTNILDDYNGNLLTVSNVDDSWEYFYGLYTQDGAQVFEDKYSELSFLADNKYMLCDGTYYGVSQVSGTTTSVVIPMKYQEMRIHTHQFIELREGSKYSVVDLSNNVVVPESNGEIEVFTSAIKQPTGIGEALDRLVYTGREYDHYDKSLMPFCIKTNSGFATVYADFMTGKAEGQVPFRASNANDGGWFVYQGTNGWYGFARMGDGFLDVAPDQWFTKEVEWAAEKGYVNGRGGNKFDPFGLCSQQDILLMIWRSKGKPAPTSTAPVQASEYAMEAVSWAYEQGMIDGTFVGGANCTRAQAVQFLWIAAGRPSAASSGFTDVPADYLMAANWAAEKGITKGIGGGLFDPYGTCQRCMIATFLYRAQNN